MAGNVTKFTDGDFEQSVLKADKLTIVDFWAEWCAPCRMIAPTLEELAGEYPEQVSIGKLNVDENAQTATKYGIRSIPTLLFFKDGAVLKQVVGVRSKAELKQVIDQNV
ncbi:MAG: thioredoxin [Nitrospinota bacterium]|nr:thioredoxin [Nitrospinota bacterium]